MNKDEAKGRVKEAAGSLTDDDELRAKGKADRGSGKAKDLIDNARRRWITRSTASRNASTAT